MKAQIMKFLKDEEGQALTEYGLILALIAVVAIGAISLIGTNLTTKLGAISDSLK